MITTHLHNALHHFEQIKQNSIHIKDRTTMETVNSCAFRLNQVTILTTKKVIAHVHLAHLVGVNVITDKYSFF